MFARSVILRISKCFSLNHLNKMSDSKQVKIGTHSGMFHCDEVLACFMLKCLPEYKSAEIVRTRDEPELTTCDIIVDVGGVYDPARHRYDHHQRSFQETIHSLNPEKPWTIKLSSAGLVYYHFGQRVLQNILGIEDKQLLENVYWKGYESFVREVDAVDNGIPQFDGEPLYHVSTGLSARVSRLNPEWNSSGLNETEQFFKAMSLVGDEFTDRMRRLAKVWWPAKEIVLKALESRFQVHSSGQIITLETFCPWKDHFFELESEMGLSETPIKFVLFNSTDSWRVQSVSVTPTSFVLRQPLNEAWQGMREEELCKVSGVDGCIFVHASGFIGGNRTREGALEMAIKSLNLN